VLTSTKIKEVLASITESNLAATINKLSSWHTRTAMHSTIYAEPPYDPSSTSSTSDVADWLAEEGRNLPHSEVERYDLLSAPFDVSGGVPWGYLDICNTYVTFRGKQPDKYLILSGHHDSYNYAGDPSAAEPPEVAAPGADDNGTAVAAMIEMMKIISTLISSGHTPEVSITFAFVGNEERASEYPADMGSLHHCRALQESVADVVGVINMDMIGYTDSRPPEEWQIRVNRYINDDGEWDLGKEFYGAHTEACMRGIKEFGRLSRYYHPSINSPVSDSYSYWASGYRTIYFEEYPRTPHYHDYTDTIDNLVMPYFLEMVRACTASLLRYVYKAIDLLSWTHGADGLLTITAQVPLSNSLEITLGYDGAEFAYSYEYSDSQEERTVSMAAVPTESTIAATIKALGYSESFKIPAVARFTAGLKDTPPSLIGLRLVTPPTTQVLITIQGGIVSYTFVVESAVAQTTHDVLLPNMFPGEETTITLAVGDQVASTTFMAAEVAREVLESSGITRLTEDKQSIVYARGSGAYAILTTSSGYNNKYGVLAFVINEDNEIVLNDSMTSDYLYSDLSVSGEKPFLLNDETPFGVNLKYAWKGSNTDALEICVKLCLQGE